MLWKKEVKFFYKYNLYVVRTGVSTKIVLEYRVRFGTYRKISAGSHISVVPNTHFDSKGGFRDKFQRV